MKFKEDIFPEHKDKIGGLVQFVNLPYESAVEYAWDQLRVTQKGVNFPVRTDYVVSSGEFVEKISIGQDSFLVVETINPRWIAVMGTGKFAVANRFLLPSNTAFWGDSYPISKGAETVSVRQDNEVPKCALKYKRMKYWQVGQQFRWRTEHLSIFCENVDGWYFERESWSFEGGADAPLEFEEASNYSKRLKKDRFNPNIMLSYLGFLGINLQDLNFYQGRMTVLVGTVVDILKTKMFQPLDSCIYYVNIPFDSFVEYLTRYIESCQKSPSDLLRGSGIGTYSQWKELLISWQHQNVVIQETANAEWVAIVDPYIDTSMAYFPQNNPDEPYEIFVGSSPEMCDYILRENLLEKQKQAQQFSIKACAVELEDPRFPSFGGARPTYLACSWGSSAISGEQSPENKYYSHHLRRSLWAASTLGSQGLTRFSVNSWPGEIEEGRKKNPNFMELDWSEWGPDPTFRPDPDRPVYEWFNHRVVDRWEKI